MQWIKIYFQIPSFFSLLKKFCFSFTVIIFLPCSCIIYQQFGIRAILLEGSMSWVNPKMETETTFSHVAPPIFDSDNYQAWAIRMTVHLEALDLWEAVEEDYDVPPLPTNPTMTQLKTHKERKTRKSKAKAYLFSAVSSTIFTRIMNLESAKDI